MISAFPKIFTLGDKYIQDIFKEDVEITEKLDGSQFVFCQHQGELYMRSKGAIIYKDNPQQMFQLAIDYVTIQWATHNLTEDMVYFCEYMSKPKHNCLAYRRVPKNNLMLFSVMDLNTKEFVQSHHILSVFADALGIEVAPLLFRGRRSSVESLIELLERDSIFGNVKIEGFVVKNYERSFLLGGQPIPLMAGKFVSEAFKEKHKVNWKGENTGKGKWDLFKESFRTEARWSKAVQHLRDSGGLEESVRDIGKLIHEAQNDITNEEIDNIKSFLWKEFGNDLLRNSIRGLPEWYKEQLAAKSFE